MSVAQDGYRRAGELIRTRAVSELEYRDAEGKYRISQARLAEAQAVKRALQAKGTLEAEGELARREKDLADAQALLRLLEAGSRPEEVEAERARLARLQEEARYLEQLQEKLRVYSPVPGLVTTPRLREKVGQFLREGDLLCTVEEPAGPEAEITLPEQDVGRVQPGQPVALKARALPFDLFTAEVDRIAPAARQEEDEVQSHVTVCCRLKSPPPELRPGMTGYARICTGRRPIGTILLDRVLRFLRTEFWW